MPGRAVAEAPVDAPHQLGRRRRAAAADADAGSTCRARRSRGHSSRSQICVGTPTKFVTRSRSISSSARVGSHLCIITSFEPAAKQREHHRHAAGHVEERHDQDEAGGFAARRRARACAGRSTAARHANADQRLDHGAMRRDRALRVAGGARRVQDRGVVVGVDVDLGQRRSPAHDHVLPVIDAGRTRRPVRTATMIAMPRSLARRRGPLDPLGVGDQHRRRRSRASA